jgi:hypothetical protein
MKKFKINITEALERCRTERQYQNVELLKRFQSIEKRLETDHERAVAWVVFVESNQPLLSLNIYLKQDFGSADYQIVLDLLKRGILRVYMDIDPKHIRAMIEISA